MTENITVTLTHKNDYRFEVDFNESFKGFVSDIEKPSGGSCGPAQTHMLLAAVANCLSVSFLYSLNRFGIDGGNIVTKAMLDICKRDGVYRVGKINVAITTGKSEEEMNGLGDVLSGFENISAISRSVLEGIPIETHVFDRKGIRLK
ncbi:OsmC family protein [Oxalobacter formigenes]|uniref:OsmC-like protein n=1 Tax=Oxalobacter formigenes OXCC13 TaxID=556269 RepID=C3XAG1_OXAFO|nr:OsmC family protein [Oxalobacter formigenes]ARQ45664.1 hypothetical protein BRW83_0914 [Oxalobacter formigenes]ARQ77904.1 hypothetical protein BRW84_04215 [Oxalobacter formigenes OXCC13]EEO30187.1 hypothetical protein OFBG_01215 [Oxalobacter formigenes OXCC13]MCZ4063062.1 OsmC family protein [Oxalobacter formigenes]QDX33549.1 hypothetical protein FPZ51_08190 [Oxalobacter formigenes]